MHLHSSRPAPTTVLDFLLGVCVMVSTLLLAIVALIVDDPGLHWLIACIVVFIICGAVALVYTILRIAERDPTPLISGTLSSGLPPREEDPVRPMEGAAVSRQPDSAGGASVASGD